MKKPNALFYQLRVVQKFQVSIKLAHPTWDFCSESLRSQERDIFRDGSDDRGPNQNKGLKQAQK